MHCQAMKRHGGNLNAYDEVKEANPTDYVIPTLRCSGESKTMEIGKKISDYRVWRGVGEMNRRSLEDF